MSRSNDPRRRPMATPRRPPERRRPERRRDSRPMLVGIGAIGILGLVLFLAAGALGSPGPGNGDGPGGGSGAVVSMSPPAASPSLAPASSPEASPSPRPSTTPTPVPLSPVAVVPVTHFRAALDSVTIDDVAATLDGSSKWFTALEVVESEAAAVFEALGIDRPVAGSEHLVLATDAASVTADMAAHRDRLAFIRADAVGPAVRALAWGDGRLFGIGAVERMADWPLVATLPVSDASFEPTGAWTLVAGGDILLDRGIHYATRIQKRGVDFPFDGGYADITSRYCCSSFGWALPKVKRAGGAGTVRGLLEGADLAIANFENPAPDKWRFHEHGTVFSAEPAKIEGLADAGIDWVSLANNHIRDAGGAAISQTRANLAEFGIEFGGAGKNLAEARKPSLLTVGSTTVAILAYDTIAKYYAATAEKAGSAQLSAKVVRQDVAAARAAGADVVIVFPHWGVEYRAKPTTAQRELGHAAIDAGADMVIGSHSHWAGAMEVYEGKPIWYSLGNFVFDQTWSEPTMEGLTLELTFDGSELVQARMRPHLILDRAQPNLLDPAGDGRVVMDQVYAASKGLLPW